MRAQILIVLGTLAIGACAKRPDVAVASPRPAPSATASTAGVTHVIREIGERTGYRFEPDTMTVKQGDSVRFVMVSGGPHNVAFDRTKLSDAAHAALSTGMPDQIADLSGNFVMQPGETYTVSFKNAPPGTYAFFCVPHLAMNQRGVITVVPR